MKRVDLDKAYDRWRDDNIEKLKERFLEVQDFEDFVQEAWQEYQDENGLIDKDNTAFIDLSK